MNGLLLGLIFSAIFVLGTASPPISAFVGVMFIGIALGMLLSIIGYALMRRRRDFASVTQVLADHYDVTVLPTSIHRARQVLGAGPVGPVATPVVVRPPVPTEPAPPASPAQEPPRYGERITPPTAADPNGTGRSEQPGEAASPSEPRPESDDQAPPRGE